MPICDKHRNNKGKTFFLSLPLIHYFNFHLFLHFHFHQAIIA